VASVLRLPPTMAPVRSQGPPMARTQFNNYHSHAHIKLTAAPAWWPVSNCVLICSSTHDTAAVSRLSAKRHTSFDHYHPRPHAHIYPTAAQFWWPITNRVLSEYPQTIDCHPHLHINLTAARVWWPKTNCVLNCFPSRKIILSNPSRGIVTSFWKAFNRGQRNIFPWCVSNFSGMSFIDLRVGFSTKEMWSLEQEVEF
jgi:hypothetical protein